MLLLQPCAWIRSVFMTSRAASRDAKSILGMMSLDYTKPVLLVSENPSELERVYEALHN